MSKFAVGDAVSIVGKKRVGKVVRVYGWDECVVRWSDQVEEFYADKELEKAKFRLMTDIPISAAQRIAEDYGYDQVVVIARKVGTSPETSGEHVTTYGTTKKHCKVAAKMGDYLKYKVMGWIR